MTYGMDYFLDFEDVWKFDYFSESNQNPKDLDDYDYVLEECQNRGNELLNILESDKFEELNPVELFKLAYEAKCLRVYLSIVTSKIANGRMPKDYSSEEFKIYRGYFNLSTTLKEKFAEKDMDVSTKWVLPKEKNMFVLTPEKDPNSVFDNKKYLQEKKDERKAQRKIKTFKKDSERRYNILSAKLKRKPKTKLKPEQKRFMTYYKKMLDGEIDLKTLIDKTTGGNSTVDVKQKPTGYNAKKLNNKKIKIVKRT